MFVLISVVKKKKKYIFSSLLLFLLLSPRFIRTTFFRNLNFEKFSKNSEFELRTEVKEKWNECFVTFTGAVIEEHRRSTESGSNDNFLRDAKLKGMHDAQCHYLGRVHGHSGDSALSTCYGLVSQLAQLFLIDQSFETWKKINKQINK